jgi:hypothetical protein
MAIRFYSTKEAYGCFSNFSRHPVNIGGSMWPTSEHFYQAQKFMPTEPDYAELIRQAEKPKIAANMGRAREHKMREDWEEVKDDYMRLAVLYKFSQNEGIREILLGTGKEIIIEATTDDYCWGEGTEKNGKNMLGRILMEVRNALRCRDDLEKRIRETEFDDVREKLKFPLMVSYPSTGTF